jgi:hypothetical protein
VIIYTWHFLVPNLQFILVKEAMAGLEDIFASCFCVMLEYFEVRASLFYQSRSNLCKLGLCYKLWTMAFSVAWLSLISIVGHAKGMGIVLSNHPYV